MNKQKIITIALAVLLVGTLSFIGFGKYQNSQFEMKQEVYQQGAGYGYEQAILQVAQMATTCEQVPLNIQNQTINMIAVECLRQSGGN
jgi:hypothetical protein